MPDLALLSVIAIVLLALVFAFTNGFHDAANSITTVVSTRVPALESGPGFRRRYDLASSTGGIETVWTWMSKASRSPLPWFPDPHPQSQLAPQRGVERPRRKEPSRG